MCLEKPDIRGNSIKVLAHNRLLNNNTSQFRNNLYLKPNCSIRRSSKWWQTQAKLCKQITDNQKGIGTLYIVIHVMAKYRPPRNWPIWYTCHGKRGNNEARNDNSNINLDQNILKNVNRPAITISTVTSMEEMTFKKVQSENR